MLLWQLNLDVSLVTGTGTHVAAGATQSASGTPIVTASGSHVKPNGPTQTTAGSPIVTSSGTHTAGAATQSANGTPIIIGSSVGLAGGATQSASGGGLVSGSGTHLAAAAILTAEGTLWVVGSGEHFGPAALGEGSNIPAPTGDDSPFVTEFGVAGPWGNYSGEGEDEEDPSDGSEFYSIWGSYSNIAARLERAATATNPLTRRLAPSSTRRRGLSTDLDP